MKFILIYIYFLLFYLPVLQGHVRELSPSGQSDELILSVVEKDSLFGIIDKNGDWYISNVYQYIDEISEGFVHAVEKNFGPEGFIHLKTKTFIPLEYWNKGQKVENHALLSVCDYTFLYSIVQGYDTVYKPSKNLNDSLGKLAISCDSLAKNNYTFVNNIAPIGINTREDIRNEYENSSWGYLYKSGKWLIPPKNCFATIPSQNILLYANNNQVYYKTLNGSLLTTKEYSGGMPFSEDLACVGEGDSLFFCWGNIVVYNHGKWGYINLKGDEVIPLQFDFAQPFSEGLAVVCLNDKYGFIDKTGKIVIPCKFDAATDFSYGLCGVLVDSLWGIMNKNGKILVEPKFEEFNGYKNGLATVKYNGKWGCVNTSGQYAIEPNYSYIYGFCKVYDKNCLDCLLPKNIFANDEVDDIIIEINIPDF